MSEAAADIVEKDEEQEHREAGAFLDAAKKAAQPLRKDGEGGRNRGRRVSLTLEDKPAPPITENGKWTGRVASWFVENGVEKGLELGEMEGRVLRETGEAVLFRRKGDEREVWIPRSVIDEVVTRG